MIIKNIRLITLLAVCFFYNFLFAANETIRKFEKSIFIENDDSTAIFAVVEKMPQFPSGDEGMIQFFDDYIIKPDAVRSGAQEGVVNVSFIVDTLGKIQKPTILKGFCKTCDEDVIRVLNLMPDWIPGEQSGKKVNVKLTVPVKFTKDSREIQLYKLGVKYYEEGNFIMADSLYTQVIRKNSSNNNAYYNRALTRFNLDNELGYCKDMFEAAQLKDQEAQLKYDEFCLKYDSIIKADHNSAKEKFKRKDTVVNEVIPEFPGGTDEMFKYIAKVTKYPNEAKDKGVSGTVFVKFVINRDGKIEGARILRGVSESCDREALRVINSMPNWKPASLGDKKVAVLFTIPIRFTLR